MLVWLGMTKLKAFFVLDYGQLIQILALLPFITACCNFSLEDRELRREMLYRFVYFYQIGNLSKYTISLLGSRSITKTISNRNCRLAKPITHTEHWLTQWWTRKLPTSKILVRVKTFWFDINIFFYCALCWAVQHHFCAVFLVYSLLGTKRWFYGAMVLLR